MTTIPDPKPKRRSSYPVSKLKPHPRNPRKRPSLDDLKASIQTHGIYKAFPVQVSTGYVLAGNHTFLAARELGLSTVPVDLLDVDDEEAERILLIDNKSSDGSWYDTETLARQLQELSLTEDGLRGTGYDTRDLEAMLAKLQPPTEDDEPDDGDATPPDERSEGPSGPPPPPAPPSLAPTGAAPSQSATGPQVTRDRVDGGQLVALEIPLTQEEHEEVTEILDRWEKAKDLRNHREAFLTAIREAGAFLDMGG